MKLLHFHRNRPLAFILLAPTLCLGQTRKSPPKELPPSAYKLVAVTVTGTDRYKSEEVLAASGLEIGETAREEDFQKAARRLGDSGAFHDVAFTFQYAAEGTKLQFQVQDAQPFVPVQFENVIWFPGPDLLNQLHARVPLFHGQLPLTGDLADQVSEALQAMLILKGIRGTVDYTRSGPDSGPVQALVFSVSGGPRIVIRHVEFPAAAADMLPLLQSAADHLEVPEYTRSALQLQAHKLFLPVYLSRGYLKATIGEPEAKLVENTDEQATVDIAFAVDPGAQYTLSGIELTGNHVFSTPTLMQMIHEPTNQPANVVRLATDLQAMETLYGTRGYMAAKIVSEHQMDDAHHALLCRITVTEGDVFNMGELEFRGVDSETAARLRNMWTIRNGEPYDSSYPERFAEQVYKQVAALKESKADVHESPNPSDKTVDVTMRFDLHPQ